MTLLPKTYGKRQGRRKRDRWGPCKECGVPTGLRCSRCKSWRCITCVRFRKVPNRVGVYALVCLPRCRARMRPEVVALIEKKVRRPAGANDVELLLAADLRPKGGG